MDGKSHKQRDSYLNQKLKENMKRNMATATSTMSGATGVLGLEARGKNQLIKELNECNDMASGPTFKSSAQRRIVFVKDAIHRNEETDEVEPPGIVDEYFDLDVSGKSIIKKSQVKAPENKTRISAY